MYEELKAELKSIVELVESLPEKYQERSFDLLLSHLLSDRSKVKLGKGAGDITPLPAPPSPPSDDESRDNGDFVIPAKVRTLLRRYSVEEAQLRALVMMEGQEVHFVHEPRNVKVATGQIQWSLLLALQSALQGRDFLVDPEAVRSICQDKGFYDPKNFSNAFRNNQTLFQRLPQPQGESVRLSSEGEEGLAALIRSLSLVQ